MKKQKRAFAILLAAALLLLPAGCGANSTDSAAPTSPGFAGQTSAAPGMDSNSAYDFETSDAKEFGWADDVPAPSPGASAAPQLPSGVKMIYRGYLDLESTQFDQTTSGLDRLVTEMGGYFESSQLYNYGSRRSAQYTVRVPAEKYQAFCAQVGQLAQVNSQRHTSENVSESYYDTQSRLETQRTKLARLQELLSKAETMEDILTIESAIADTEWYIESLTTTLRQYDALIDFSTIEISLEEVLELSPQEPLEETFGDRLVRAFRQGTRQFGRTMQSLVLSLAYGWIGWLLVLAVLGLVLWLVFRRRAKRRKAAMRPLAPPPAPPKKPGDGDDPDDDTMIL